MSRGKWSAEDVEKVISNPVLLKIEPDLVVRCAIQQQLTHRDLPDCRGHLQPMLPGREDRLPFGPSDAQMQATQRVRHATALRQIQPDPARVPTHPPRPSPHQ